MLLLMRVHILAKSGTRHDGGEGVIPFAFQNSNNL